MDKDKYTAPFDEIKEIGRYEARMIIYHRQPLGRFWYQSDLTFVAIDNRDGNAWVEEFKDQETMMGWLNDEFQMSELEEWLNEKEE